MSDISMNRASSGRGLRLTVLMMSLVIGVSLNACGGGSNGATGGGDTTGTGGTGGGGDQPAVTAVGMPDAPPASAMIGSAGGTLNSPDGLLTLTIPAGALSADTRIVIQPIDNQAPGGVGSAYQLTPDGQTFNTPVTLTYNPAGGQPDGSELSQLGAAFQTADGTWQVLPAGTADGGLGSYSVTTTHFTDYSFFAYHALLADKSAAFVKGLVQLSVVYYDPVTADSNSPVGPTYLPNKSHAYALEGFTISYTLNGVDATSTATPSGSVDPVTPSTAVYTAPAHLPGNGNPVDAGAGIKLDDGSTLTLHKRIHLLAHKYHVVDNVEFKSICGPVGGVYGPLDYELDDLTSFDISLDDNFQITGGNFAAMAPGGPFSVTVNQGCPANVQGSGTTFTETATYDEANTDSIYATSASGGYLESLGKLHLIVTGGEVTDIPAYHYVLSANGQAVAEGDAPQSRAATDLEGIFLDGYDNEKSPDYPPLPDNPNYDNNTATITVVQE